MKRAITFTSNKELSTNFREITNEELTQKIINRDKVNITVWDKKTKLNLAGVQDKLPLVVLSNDKYGIGGRGNCFHTYIKI